MTDGSAECRSVLQRASTATVWSVGTKWPGVKRWRYVINRYGFPLEDTKSTIEGQSENDA